MILIAAVAVVATFFVDPIPQDQSYHVFADTRTILGVPNFWNVVSNLPFLIVGVIGLVVALRGAQSGMLGEQRAAYAIFFLGVLLTSFGSGYFHLDPNNDTLLFDRLPMTISFMAFFSVIIGEHIEPKAGKSLLLPLLALGVVSVLYWSHTEAAGHGDLRPYALVQFLPLVLIPMILVLFSSAFTTTAYIWVMLGLYVLAKALEFFDGQVFAMTGDISGHTVKHVVAALAPIVFLMALINRQKQAVT